MSAGPPLVGLSQVSTISNVSRGVSWFTWFGLGAGSYTSQGVFSFITQKGTFRCSIFQHPHLHFPSTGS